MVRLYTLVKKIQKQLKGVKSNKIHIEKNNDKWHHQ